MTNKGKIQAETVRHKSPVEKSKANHPFLAKWESKIKSRVFSLETGFLHQHRTAQNKQPFYMWVAGGFPEGSQPGTDVLRREGVKVVGVSPPHITITAASCTAPSAARSSCGHSITQLTLFLPPLFLPSTGTAGSVSPVRRIRFLPSDMDV